MIRWINLWVVRFKARISALYNTRVVTEPYADLEQAWTGTGEQGSERVTHDMGCYPSKLLPFHMLVERSGEIVTITVTPMPDVGPEHKRLAQAVGVQEYFESSCERHSAFLPILEVDRRRFAQMLDDEEYTPLE
jgi:hypothetical protein